MAKQVLKYHDVQLYESDVALFTGSQWLNDNAINFYLQYLTQTVVPHDMLLMDPAVVSCLLHQCKDEDEYKELADGLDLKSKRICLIPVTDNVTLGGKSSHWSLLVYRNGDFQHFDSSSGHNKTAAQRVANSFKSILQAAGRSDELKDFTRVQEVQDAPQQQNSYDCGVYVLIAAEFISLQHKGEIEVMYLRDYATPQRVTALRMQMPKLIRGLQDKWQGKV